MTAKDSPLCKKCKYHNHLGHATKNAEIICFYIAHTYKMRGCPVENCTKFEPGRAKKIKEAIM